MKKSIYNTVEVSSVLSSGTKEKRKDHFFGFYYRFLKKAVNIFTRNYKFKVDPPTNEPKVFICRHKNTKGVIKVMKSATFDTHPFMLSVFQNFKSAFGQFYGYTFTKRMKLPKFIAVFLAFFCALFVPPLFKSSKAIPTYRKGAKALTTLKTANDYLLKGESVIIFPDVDYTSESDTVGDIYEGFLYLEKLYFQKTLRHLEFIPVKIEDDKRLITQSESITFNGVLPYKVEAKKVASQIKNNM